MGAMEFSVEQDRALVAVQQWLKAGDRVRVEIDGLGYIENQIVTEPGQTVIG